MRRLLALAALAASLLITSPVAAASGLHVAPTADADAAGCHGLDVWYGNQKLKTIPANDGPDSSHPSCAYNRWSGVLPNGYLIFDWNAVETSGSRSWISAAFLSSNGTRVGTQGIGGNGGDWSCGGPTTFEIVDQTAFMEDSCYIWATRGTNHTTFRLPGDSPTTYARTGPRIVYYATDTHSGAGKELFRSNGTRDGSYLLRDINPGPGSSSIREMTSHGKWAATFTANDGHGRAIWMSNGTVKGTHKVNS